MVAILVVEDDIDLIETYIDLLESKGYTVLSATRLAEAETHLNSTCPEIVTLDLNLPGTSTHDVAAFMSTIKAYKKTKTIVISGHPEIVTGVSWVDDADLVLTKPVDNLHLLRMIERLLT